ncbi:MAG: HYR domain-containing protein [Ilumatobacter sp.]|uniref:HYR domain-containing protein n=1 Tax=Ilumatobacter sp. TaxID=1967498 RepID=UPI00391B3406
MSHSRAARGAVSAVVAFTSLASVGPSVEAQPAAPDPLATVTPIDGAESSDPNVLVLSNGNYVIGDESFSRGDSSGVGAVSLYDGRTNALISRVEGNFTSDRVGRHLFEVGDSNVLVGSPNANFFGVPDLGAVTWIDGRRGLGGRIGLDNSLIGSQISDRLGASITVLTSGHAVVSNSSWSPDESRKFAGAVTWIDGDRGLVGTQTVDNSLYGTQAGDYVGTREFGDGVAALANGDFIVGSRVGQGERAITYAKGDGSTIGPVTVENSLGGLGQTTLYPMGGDGFVLASHGWNLGNRNGVGAVAWINGADEVRGVLTPERVLHGTTALDRVGVGGVVQLDDHSALVMSPYWSTQGRANVGAVTVLRSDDSVTGPVSSSNSLHGTNDQDQIGQAQDGGVESVPGAAVIVAEGWDNGPVEDAGAATWIAPDAPPVGPISAANSVLGSTTGDFERRQRPGNVFEGARLTPLADGQAVLRLPAWDDGDTEDVGAVVYMDATGSTNGTVSTTTSLHGTRPNDQVGIVVEALTDGRYVVGSPYWSAATASSVGAATWAATDGSTVGAVSEANSLHGTTTNDQIGNDIVADRNGRAVVTSPDWTFGSFAIAGAVTWVGAGETPIGPVTPTNSLHGTRSADLVGGGGATVLSDGSVIVRSPEATVGGREHAGAVTRFSASPPVGPISSANSLVGSTAGNRLGSRIADLGRGDVFLGPGANAPTWAFVASSATYLGIVPGSASFDMYGGSFDPWPGGSGNDREFVDATLTSGDGAVFAEGFNAPTFPRQLIVNVERGPVFVDPPERVSVVLPPGSSSGAVWYSTPVAIDTTSSAAVSCSPAPGSVLPVGEKVVSCTATDQGNLQTLTSFTLDVQAPTELPDVMTADPLRLLDTRTSGTTVDGDFAGDGRLAAGSVLEFDIAGRGNVPTSGAAAAIVNVTAVRPDDRGFITVYPCATRPLASSLNMSAAGGIFGNEIVAGLDADGRTCIYTSTDTDLTIDLAGWIPDTSTYTPVTPARLLDTRPDSITIDATNTGQGRNAATGGALEVQITGRAGVPTTATTAVLNLTGINPDRRGFVTAYPCGQRPLASSLNFDNARIVRGNELIAPLSPTGSICLHSSTATDLTLDVAGYFTAGDFNGITPARVFESRIVESTIDGDGEHNKRIHGGETVRIPITGRAGVPTDARSVVVNATAVNSIRPGYLSLFPCNGRPPTASVNVTTPGAIVGNEVAVDLSAAGDICAFSTATTDLTIDLAGYITS